MQQLKQQGAIDGWRDELYPITTAFDQAPLAVVERAAAVYMGIKSYGVHLNGYQAACSVHHVPRHHSIMCIEHSCDMRVD